METLAQEPEGFYESPSDRSQVTLAFCCCPIVFLLNGSAPPFNRQLP